MQTKTVECHIQFMKLVKQYKMFGTKEKEKVNILVIGNGFDLAHGLPTRYTDFLDWVRVINMIGEKLAWVDEIPLDVEGANKWLNNESLPKMWRVKSNDDFMEAYLHADAWTRKNMEETDQFRDWMAEHKINAPNSSFYEDSIRHELKKNHEIIKIAPDSALSCLLEAIEILKKCGNLNNGSLAEDFFLRLGEDCKKYHHKQEGVKTKVSIICGSPVVIVTYKPLDYLLKEIFYLTKQNFWISYFLYVSKVNRDTWIDFENEISKVIQSCSYINSEGRIILDFPQYIKDFFKEEHNSKNFINRLE